MEAPPLGSITEQLEGHLDVYDIEAEEVEAVAGNPDALQQLDIEDGPTIWLMLGRSEDGGEPGMLVVGVENEYDDGMGLTHAYRIYEDLRPESVGTDDRPAPFEMLRTLIDEFGLLVHIGPVEDRLIFDRRVPLDGTALLDVIEYSGLPNGHTADGEFMVREMESEEGERIAHCGLVFAIDRTAYRTYLHEKGSDTSDTP